MLENNFHTNYSYPKKTTIRDTSVDKNFIDKFPSLDFAASGINLKMNNVTRVYNFCMKMSFLVAHCEDLSVELDFHITFKH